MVATRFNAARVEKDYEMETGRLEHEDSFDTQRM
jgi:hypothetical protein